ncbi:GIP [Symbiodinium sp. CCMP2456]|nr:GIP [Symbiodinium sp. CCMP2456]
MPLLVASVSIGALVVPSYPAVSPLWVHWTVRTYPLEPKVLGYDDPHGEMLVDDEDMPPPRASPNRILMMILSSLVPVVILLRILPEAARRCRRRMGTQSWIRHAIRTMVEDGPQGPGRKCVRGALTWMICLRLSRSWCIHPVLRWCCCLDSRQERRIPILRVTFRLQNLSAVPGLPPMTEGEFPIQQAPIPEPTPEPPVPDAGGESDVLIRLPKNFSVPSFVPLDGDGFASWLTKQDKIKAGTLAPETQRKYVKGIRTAKLEEFKVAWTMTRSGLPTAASLDVTSVFSLDVGSLPSKFKNGYFSKFKAGWVCRGFQDKFAWDQQTDSSTPTRCGFHLDLKTACLQGEHYNLSSRSVVVQLPPDIGLPPWTVGLCLRPVYGLNDAARKWWNRLDKFLWSVGLEPTRADRCTYVAYDGIEDKKGKIGCSGEHSSRLAASFPGWPQHPLLQPLVTVRS